MANKIDKNSITISKNILRKRGGVVVLPLIEYEKLKSMAIPTYKLKGRAAEELDGLVKRGLKEYKEGRTIGASSLKEALKIYRRKENRKN